MENLKAALYLIPNTLGETAYDKVLPEYNRQVLRGIKHFIVESRREAIRFIKLADSDIDIDSLSFVELNEHTDLKTIGNILDPLVKQKLPMGIISDAGCPAVADPGAAAVEMAQKKGLDVVPLAGPSSMIMAVMASGFNGQSFAFNGYLPVKPNERVSKLHQLESRAYKEDQTQLFIEAPYRNLKMLDTIVRSLRKETMVCIAAGITTKDEFIRTMSVEQWKKQPEPPIQKVPGIFLIYKG
ncbi:MAG: SAM-dependent methyltransferase [Treponema sp.]|nr:SAM-dependent methyltransferase [Candidatus Treponema equi]